MKVSKILSGAMLFSVLLITVGCAKGSDSTASKDQKDSIEILNDKNQGTGKAKTFVPILEKETGLSVKFINTPDLSSYQTNIQQSLQGNDAPALFTWWTGSMLKDLVKNDLVEDLSDQWADYEAAGVSDQIKDALSVDGKVYGAPLNMIYNGVYYNKEIFNKYGIEEPQTFDEFLNVCKVLKENGETPIGIGNTWQSFCWPQALMGSLDPDLYEEWIAGKVPFTDERVKTVFYQWIDMIQKGYFSDVQQDQIKEFSGNKTAMFYHATNSLTSLNEDYGLESGKDIDMFILPAKNSADKKAIFYEVAPLLVGKNSSNKENAKKVLKGYFTQEVQQEYADKTGMAAVTNVSFNDPISKKLVDEVNDTDNYSLHLRYYEQFNPELVNFSIDEYWKIFSDPTKDQVDKSLEAIQNKWESLNK